MKTTVERVRELREERGIGMLQAKQEIQKQDLIADILQATTVTDLKLILLRMAQ